MLAGAHRGPKMMWVNVRIIGFWPCLYLPWGSRISEPAISGGGAHIRIDHLDRVRLYFFGQEISTVRGLSRTRTQNRSLRWVLMWWRFFQVNYTGDSLLMSTKTPRTALCCTTSNMRTEILRIWIRMSVLAVAVDLHTDHLKLRFWVLDEGCVNEWGVCQWCVNDWGVCEWCVSTRGVRHWCVNVWLVEWWLRGVWRSEFDYKCTRCRRF